MTAGASLPRCVSRPSAWTVLALLAIGCARSPSSGSTAPPPASSTPGSDGAVPTPSPDPAAAPSSVTPGGPPDDPAPITTPACFVAPRCDAAPPPAGVAEGFRATSSTLKAATGTPNHRVHDLLLAPSDAQWVIGTFVYDGITSSRLAGEDVDVELLRGCGDTWELLGTARTTSEGAHAPVEGVIDAGGQIYFQIPATRALGIGRHRLRLVVRGDLTAAEGFIEVQRRGTSTFVSDIDGTLTPSDLSEVGGILTGTIPDANAGAADALTRLAALGYRPIYLTARTGSELRRSREFLSARGFPPGIVRTAEGDGLVGLSGAAAARFKAGELALVQGHGLAVALGIGNADTDAQAYQQAGLARGFLLGTDAGAAYGAARFDAYAELVQRAALPALCVGP